MYLRDKNGRVAQLDPTHSDNGVIFASGMIETAKQLGDLVMCIIGQGRRVFVLLKGRGSDESSSTLIREY